MAIPCHETNSYVLPIFAKQPSLPIMSTMNISLPDSLKAFVDSQVSERGYGTSSEYVRELIRRDQDRRQLRALLLEGAASPLGPLADQAYFDALRGRVRHSGGE
jgi:antitoxin ParD1/3/4